MFNGRPQPYLATVRCKLCKGQFSGVTGILGFKINNHTKYVCYDCLKLLAPDAMMELADQYKYESECAAENADAILKALKAITPTVQASEPAGENHE